MVSNRNTCQKCRFLNPFEFLLLHEILPKDVWNKAAANLFV